MERSVSVYTGHEEDSPVVYAIKNNDGRIKALIYNIDGRCSSGLFPIKDFYIFLKGLNLEYVETFDQVPSLFTELLK